MELDVPGFKAVQWLEMEPFVRAIMAFLCAQIFKHNFIKRLPRSVIYWGSKKNKGITRGVDDLWALKSWKLIEISLLTPGILKLIPNGWLFCLSFLEDAEPPWLLLPLFHRLPAKNPAYSKSKKATEPWRDFNLWQMVWRVGSASPLAVNGKRAHTPWLLGTGHV